MLSNTRAAPCRTTWLPGCADPGFRQATRRERAVRGGAALQHALRAPRHWQHCTSEPNSRSRCKPWPRAVWGGSERGEPAQGGACGGGSTAGCGAAGRAPRRQPAARQPRPVSAGRLIGPRRRMHDCCARLLCATGRNRACLAGTARATRRQACRWTLTMASRRRPRSTPTACPRRRRCSSTRAPSGCPPSPSPPRPSAAAPRPGRGVGRSGPALHPAARLRQLWYALTVPDAIHQPQATLSALRPPHVTICSARLSTIACRIACEGTHGTQPRRRSRAGRGQGERRRSPGSR